MKIKLPLVIRLAALFLITLLFGLVGRTLVTNWQISQQIDQQIVDQRNPVLNKKLLHQVAKEIKSFPDNIIKEEKLPESFKIEKEKESPEQAGEKD